MPKYSHLTIVSTAYLAGILFPAILVVAASPVQEGFWYNIRSVLDNNVITVHPIRPNDTAFHKLSDVTTENLNASIAKSQLWQFSYEGRYISSYVNGVMNFLSSFRDSPNNFSAQRKWQITELSNGTGILQMKNGWAGFEEGKCLTNPGVNNILKHLECNVEEARQQWKVEKVSEVVES